MSWWNRNTNAEKYEINHTITFKGKNGIKWNCNMFYFFKFKISVFATKKQPVWAFKLGLHIQNVITHQTFHSLNVFFTIVLH